MSKNLKILLRFLIPLHAVFRGLKKLMSIGWVRLLVLAGRNTKCTSTFSYSRTAAHDRWDDRLSPINIFFPWSFLKYGKTICTSQLWKHTQRQTIRTMFYCSTYIRVKTRLKSEETNLCSYLSKHIRAASRYPACILFGVARVGAILV